MQYFINRLLSRAGWQFSLKKIETLPEDVESQFREQSKIIAQQRAEFTVIEEFRDDSQAHPVHYRTFECEFSSEQIANIKPGQILDIGSYRDWLAGVMAAYPVTTVDVRDRESRLSNETVINQDVRNLELDDNSIDMLTTLHTIEHFGLGRYGDTFDPLGDVKAVNHFIRVVKPGGHFLLSVPVTAGDPCIAFNSHRIYSMEMVRAWVNELSLVDEIFIKRKPARLCDESELATQIGEFDVYCGCYRKPG